MSRESHIGEVIFKFREYRGWTQTELARRTGITRNYLSIIERGMRTPSLETLQAIAKAMNCDLVIKLQPKEMDL